MCRLCAMTSSAAVSAELKLNVMHEIMLRTSRDEGGQNDGWGVTDGRNIWKSPIPYFEDVPTWIHKAETDRFLISHVRRASTNTQRTVLENHPYAFDINGEALIAAHNGWMEAATWKDWRAGSPQTDSWRALNDLANFLREGEEPSPELFNKWLSMYSTGSHYAFLLLWRNELLAIRGNTRTLHLLPVADGYLLHTSLPALQFANKYLNQMYDLPLSTPLRMLDNTYLKFRYGDPNYESYALDPKHPVAKSVHQGYTWNDPKKVEASEVVPVGEKRGDDEGVYAPSVTSPRVSHRKKIVDPEQLKDTQPLALLPGTDAALKRKKEKWSQLAGKLSPMRASLSRFWVSHILGFVDDKGEPSEELLQKCTITDLEVLEEILFPREKEGTKIFSDAACIMLNWWNHCVIPTWDVRAHSYLFGTEFFWINPKYIEVDGKPADPYVASATWIKDVSNSILDDVNSGEFPVSKWFDMDKVRKDAHAANKRSTNIVGED